MNETNDLYAYPWLKSFENAFFYIHSGHTRIKQCLSKQELSQIKSYGFQTEVSSFIDVHKINQAKNYDTIKKALLLLPRLSPGKTYKTNKAYKKYLIQKVIAEKEIMSCLKSIPGINSLDKEINALRKKYKISIKNFILLRYYIFTGKLKAFYIYSWARDVLLKEIDHIGNETLLLPITPETTLEEVAELWKYVIASFTTVVKKKSRKERKDDKKNNEILKLNNEGYTSEKIAAIISRTYNTILSSEAVRQKLSRLRRQL